MMKRLCASLMVGLVCATNAASETLFDESKFQSLTAIRRAATPGDVITVLIIENATASSSADTTTEKTGGFGLGVSWTNNNRNDAVAAKGNVSEDFAGKGRIQRSGKLVAQITATVKEVYPNGDLAITGQQLIVVNGEKQQIVVSGRVRPVDIGETNTIVSTRLADAQITFVGDGILAERQRPGIISRFLSWLGVL